MGGGWRILLQVVNDLNHLPQASQVTLVKVQRNSV
jgi:hypothetical protein